MGNLTFDEAARRLHGEDQRRLATIGTYVDAKLGISGTNRPVLGAWADGGENSLMMVAPGASPTQMRAASAMKGYVANQKSVLIFNPDVKGEHFLANVDVATDDLKALHNNLLKDGLPFHTLESLGPTTRVHVFGSDQETINALGKAATDYGASVKFTRGQGEFLGTTLEGSDAEQRADARRVYDETIRQISDSGGLEGRNVGKIWNDVRDYWQSISATAAAKEPAGQGSGATGGRGNGSAEQAQRSAAQAAAGQSALEGLPDKPLKFKSGQWYVPGPIGKIRDTAAAYMRAAGLPYNPPTTYAKLDKERATRVADEFDKMKHDPENPAVKASYAALVKETLAQWQAIKATGLKVEWIKPGEPDPYAETPRLAAMDVAQNNHWWGFPTEIGYGSGDPTSRANNPMLAQTNEVVGGRRLLVNDVFRIVHDYFGHFKEGVGFRAEGEENAWRSHAAMYSAAARPAMTAETRGQNSWVNFGPHGEANRKASAADTIYAPQKIGIMPEWTATEGAKSASALAFRDWEESKHPRDPAGTSTGGQFTSGGGDKEPSAPKGAGKPQTVYHGSKEAGFTEFKVPDPKQEIMADRFIGVHVAKDPELAVHFTETEPTGGWGAPKEQYKGGVYILQIPPPEKFLEVEQKHLPWVAGGVPSEQAKEPKTPRNVETDQTVIGNMVYASAFRQDPEMFGRFLSRRWAMTPQEGQEAAKAILAGTPHSMKLVRQGKPIVGLDDYISADGVLSMNGMTPEQQADRTRSRDLFLSEMKGKGYAGLKYINTSPMETEGVKDPTSFVVFDPKDIKFKYHKSFDGKITLPPLTLKDWDEEKHPREPAGTPEGGRFAGGGAAEGGDGKEPAATKAPVKLDPEVVNVGGDAWNRATAERLEREYQDVRPQLEKMANESVGKPTPGKDFDWSELGPHQQDSAYQAWEKIVNAENKYTNQQLAEMWDKYLDSEKAKIAAEQGITPIEVHDFDEDYEAYTPESWDQMNDDAQQDAQEQFIDKSKSDWIDSESDNFYSEYAPAEARKVIEEQFNGEANRTTIEWVANMLERDPNIKGPKFPEDLPFTDKQILDAIHLDYKGEGGSWPMPDTPEIDWDDAYLDDLKKTPKQLELPGIEPKHGSELLTESMRNDIEKAIGAAFDREGDNKAGSMEVPQWVVDNAEQSLGDYWDEMSDKDKFNWVQNNTDILEIEAKVAAGEEEIKLAGVDALPEKYDPLNNTSGRDYKRTQALAHYMSVERSAEIFKQRGLDKKDREKPLSDAELKQRIARLDASLWEAWKGSSISSDGILLQYATADELRGRLYTGHMKRGGEEVTRAQVERRANDHYSHVGGYEGIKAYVRAKWETTQYLLDKAGAKTLDLYRGFDIKQDVYNKWFASIRRIVPYEMRHYASSEMVPDTSYRWMPTLDVQRNGAVSTTTDLSVANNWRAGHSTGIVLRAQMPRTAIVSVPAYGINVHSEHEVVAAGTAWKGWDAWVGKAPDLDFIELREPRAAA